LDGIICYGYKLLSAGFDLDSLMKHQEENQPLILVMNEFDCIVRSMMNKTIQMVHNKSIDPELDIRDPKGELNNYFDLLPKRVHHGKPVFLFLCCNSSLDSLRHDVGDTSILRQGRVHLELELTQNVSNPRDYTIASF
jgi:hypothetical protein